jgi:hypothetical protein
MTAIMSLHQETSETSDRGNNFSTGQSWGALRKAWKGYRIAKVHNDNTKMTEYATKIRKIQGELGINVANCFLFYSPISPINTVAYAVL